MTAAANYPSDYRQWLAKLISFDTVSRNSNLPLVDYVKAYLKTVGVESTLVYNPARTHANLWATLPGEGGVTQGGIVLSGHTDVVPVDGQKWDTDPFTMVEKDGKLFGRGACDMKGFLAVVLALVPQLLSMKRAKPVHIAFSFDEEVGCRGVPYLIDYLKAKGFKADGCLIGEPTGMKVETGNKGRTAWEVKVHGKAIHSSMALMNTSCNAIEYAAQIITKIREIALDIRKNGRHDPLYTCPFASISTGVIKGGNAVNTVPAECDFMYSVRLTESQVARDIEQRVLRYVKESVVPLMKEEYPDATVKITQGVSYPAFNASEEAEATKQARRLCKDHDVHRSGGGTEAGFFQDILGIPTVIVGPGPGSMAHLPNEYVLVDQMERSMQFTTDFVKLYTDPSYCQKGKF
ncbi:glutamamyl carboxypeptidase putativemetallo-peptidase Clan MH Family M18 [Leptomonas pyrrhocoris]|uniref:Glutamamyl carboxypeptidase putativemetallo-peptidase Clan MH Family M18 n=1 Tax=Leptomonas pyrrhocoris TaxID=157538 RepID=A0A0N0DUE6_LEPPY|nr:glutamamyl carboxypeptidase putativemetallo-peptidase Clan MH Family M18 [Leptomonas pyrrhocoris]XP_015657257.1 glutamamyl carboxypeptidase putativemetallo-peptidase Clan MH Family M18 [Leptomonas pyrrhocoris]KPA78817.1 glutamamyl carboxypeptidase putativemetallo-peptidase Clan MH Family M18 [Leptomonas pyrrhocoris]KPA78818.1 glutamamyl carboxypeptidase putativemetallo-peptidase Clan MH Family M18 [Leptomonas pyrrhocoris]|eukprot:XP_015657256.1 glutamamyl carboxypeptidase putativemetallo-peptidase Clan MH Family M18 [Leptomonas pyrrhocoris]